MVILILILLLRCILWYFIAFAYCLLCTQAFLAFEIINFSAVLLLILSKGTDCVSLANCEHLLVLVTVQRQLGFKSAFGCARTLITVRMVIYDSTSFSEDGKE